jgi:hypothetical protein
LLHYSIISQYQDSPVIEATSKTELFSQCSIPGADLVAKRGHGERTHTLRSLCSPQEAVELFLPLSEVLLCYVVRFVDHLRWDSKPGPHLDREMAKVVMPTKHGANHHQQGRINGCHNNQGTNPIRPRAVLETPLQAKSL